MKKRISLGVYPEISLKIAREQRDRARHLVATGIDPVVAFRSGFPKNETGEASETFHAVAEEWFAKFEKGWKTSHSRTIKSRLEKYAYPELGKKILLTYSLRMYCGYSVSLKRTMLLKQQNEHCQYVRKYVGMRWQRQEFLDV